MMNQQDKIELSKRVAEKYGIKDSRIEYVDYDIWQVLWLADDDARCFRLALDKYISTYINEFNVQCNIALSSFTEELLNNHSDRYEATRIAILKCLDAMKD
jgi:hypothetical protein